MVDGAIVETRSLVKDFGTVRALDGLDLRVERSEVFGFVGPNGAGKSTTIRVLLDLLRPTSGTALVFGETPRTGGPALRSRIGYLPGDLLIEGNRTAGEFLAHLASLRDGRGEERVPQLAERFGLDLHRPIRTLSKGNRQKIGVVQAFMHRPELLILDEPTSGLDPLLQHEFRDCVRESCADGATVVLSSHVLAEVEEVAGRVAVIRQGALVDVDDVAVLRHRAGQRVVLTFAGPVPLAEIEKVAGVEDAVGDGATVTCRLHGSPDELLKVAARHEVTAWSAEDRDLEDLFLDFYRLPVGGGDDA